MAVSWVNVVQIWWYTLLYAGYQHVNPAARRQWKSHCAEKSFDSQTSSGQDNGNIIFSVNLITSLKFIAKRQKPFFFVRTKGNGQHHMMYFMIPHFRGSSTCPCIIFSIASEFLHALSLISPGAVLIYTGCMSVQKHNVSMKKLNLTQWWKKELSYWSCVDWAMFP